MQRRSFLVASALAPALSSAFRPALAQKPIVQGAGTSFLRTFYTRWGQEAAKETGFETNFEAASSDLGIAKATQRVVDFGACESPLSPGRLRERALVQFPSCFGAMVVAATVPGVERDRLRLTPDVLADIFLGKISKWNDPRIVEHNRDLRLPDLAIVPIYRTDPAGTNYVFTVYLSRVSEAWAAGPRAGTVVRWPEGGKEAKGIAGVAKAIKETPGAIGVSNVFTARASELATVQLRNRSGAFVKAGTDSFAAAAAAAEWTPQNTADAIDTNAAAAWPIVSPTFILLPSNPAAERVQATLGAMKLFDWAYRNGADIARELGYTPLPEAAQASIRASWDAVRGPDGKPIWGA
ncbi:phosphate ABC transporter substrate-binding protein PstS [Craurococcus roseus]|uniref:Phosphate-binding protein PstS n=1 Tax=Craurococcus roseus TaxID=77585 RepID=A0ABN1FJC3_9PROT